MLDTPRAEYCIIYADVSKTTCKEQGPEEEACTAFTEGYLESFAGEIAFSEEEGRAACEVGAGIFFDYCVNGVP